MNKTQNKYQILFIYLFLIVTTVIVYQQVHNFDFINYDDPVYITDNPQVFSGFTRENIIWIFNAGYAGNWHPLTWLSHMLDCQLFGLNAGPHHLVNLLFHIANVLLLFTVLRQISGALWQSAFVAALFALHPLHVESIAWISERKDVLSTLFWILTMAAYFRYVKNPTAGRYILALVLFALGLMSKPMLVTLPFVLLLLDYWPLERFQLKFAELKILLLLVREKVPFFILSLISCVATFIAQKIGSAIVTTYELSLRARITNCFISYIKYTTKMLWPAELAVFYPYHINTTPFWQVALAALLLLGTSIFIIHFAQKYKYLLTGWLWYMGTLVPVIGLVQVGEQAMADRYTYVPLIGLFIIIAWGIPDLLAKWKYRKIALIISASLVLLALSICTYFQAGYWHNTTTLFEHSIAVTSNNHIAHHMLAFCLYQQGKIDQAVNYNLEALRINPAFSPACTGLGIAFMQKGEIDKAVKYYRKALQLKPDYPEVMNNLAWLYATQKETLFYNPEQAIQLAQRACELTKYQDASMLDTLAAAYSSAGKFPEATATAEKALKLTQAAGNKQLTDRIRQRLDLYKKGEPCLESVSK